MGTFIAFWAGFFVAGSSAFGGMPEVIPAIKEIVQPYRACAAHASDYREFCPTEAPDEACLGAIIAAIVELESGGDPGKTFDEANYSPGMKPSIGLMQLSTGECTEGDNLKDPKLNLTCGVRKFCQLVNRDNVIAKGKNGAAAYWSVLRDPSTLTGKDDKTIAVGKRKEIINLVPGYMQQMMK